jgi:hypothetical protein
MFLIFIIKRTLFGKRQNNNLVAFQNKQKIIDSHQAVKVPLERHIMLQNDLERAVTELEKKLPRLSQEPKR